MTKNPAPLLQVWRPTEESTLPLSVAAPITVGRRPSSTIVLTDPRVSAEHLTFSIDENGCCSVTDYSTNGSFLNGKPLVKNVRMMLSEGDVCSPAQRAIRHT